MEFLANTLDLFLDAAPWLLFGLLAAGVLRGLISEDLMRRWLGGPGIWPVAKAAVIGAPVPLCSCGVLPAALTLRRSGASKGATVSFLIATPETGADSVTLSYALLGPFMAIARPLAAVGSAIAVGVVTVLFEKPHRSLPQSDLPSAAPGPASCCTASCCGGRVDGHSPKTGTRLADGLRYAMTDVLDDIALWLVVGLVLAGIVTTLVPPMALAEMGSGFGAKLLMLLIGIPMYICATASTPLAASLLLAGVSPGTVLVFLLAGPATNLATLGVIQKELGRQVSTIYLTGIAVSSLCLGILIDEIVRTVPINVTAELEGSTTFLPLWVQVLSALVLVACSLRPLRKLAARAAG